jgi:hypothetical protein
MNIFHLFEIPILNFANVMLTVLKPIKSVPSRPKPGEVTLQHDTISAKLDLVRHY